MAPPDDPLPVDPPSPPGASFASDNAAGVAPGVMAALVAADAGPALAYGEDPWTVAAEDAVADLLGEDVVTLLCWGGTGANVVGLASVLEPHHAVVAAQSAHIVVDECGAPTHATGCPVLTVPTDDGKLRPDDLDPWAEWLGTEHHPQPAVVSISQVSEMGTVYSVDELGALCERAHRHGMLVHLDGARLANALAALDVDASEMVRDAGVDVLTLGMTKAGAMYGEAVVFLRPELAGRARFARKQAGQLASKNRYIAAQLSALLADGTWIELARNANAMAARLAAAVSDVAGVEVVRPPAANSVFVRLPPGSIETLQRWSFFWEWDPAVPVARWMTGWATTAEDVDRFAAGVRSLLSGP